MRKVQDGPSTPTASAEPIVFVVVVLCAAAAIVIAVLIVGVHYFLSMFSRMNRSPSLSWLLFLRPMRSSPTDNHFEPLVVIRQRLRQGEQATNGFPCVAEPHLLGPTGFDHDAIRQAGEPS
jgi:hypothetical protein